MEKLKLENFSPHSTLRVRVGFFHFFKVKVDLKLAKSSQLWPTLKVGPTFFCLWLAIPMRAFQCTRITVQKQVRPHGTSAPMVRKHRIPLRALTFNLDPSLRTYVFPFLLRRMRFSFSVNNFHFLSIRELKEN